MKTTTQPKLSETDQKILRLIRAHGPITSSDLAVRARWSQRKLALTIRRLTDHRLIRRGEEAWNNMGRKVWKLEAT